MKIVVSKRKEGCLSIKSNKQTNQAINQSNKQTSKNIFICDWVELRVILDAINRNNNWLMNVHACIYTCMHICMYVFLMLDSMYKICMN